MKLLGAVCRSCVLAPWIFVTLASAQGGSFGWLPGYVNSTGSCNVTSEALANYVGCLNIGMPANSTPFSVTNNNTNITYGTGIYAPPFALTNYGPTSFPGIVLNGNNTFTASETPMNCTLVCRAHGMKYSMMILQECYCSPYATEPIYLFYETETMSIPDGQYSPGSIRDNSACTISGYDGFLGCWGDNSQTDCGWNVTLTYTYGDSNYSIGSMGASTFVDTTFASDSTLVLATQAISYAYLACFIMSSSTTSFIPQGFSNNFATPSQCYTFCAGVNMPYAGMTYQSGSLPVYCTCGTEFAPGSYQYLPDANQCNRDCGNGSTTTCIGGQNCCGNGNYYAVYRNPNLLGCYEPPIPGTQLVATSTYPVACFSTVCPLATASLGSYVLPNPLGTAYTPINTPIRQYQWSIPGYSQYTYIGCYNVGVLTSLYSENSETMEPVTCAAFCKSKNTKYFSLHMMNSVDIELAVLCTCGNVIAASQPQLPFSSCNFPCLGGSDPTTLCGGRFNETGTYGSVQQDYYGNVIADAVYGPTSALSTIKRTIIPTATYSCRSASTSSSHSGSSTSSLNSLSSSSSFLRCWTPTPSASSIKLSSSISSSISSSSSSSFLTSRSYTPNQVSSTVQNSAATASLTPTQSSLSIQDSTASFLLVNTSTIPFQTSPSVQNSISTALKLSSQTISSIQSGTTIAPLPVSSHTSSSTHTSTSIAPSPVPSQTSSSIQDNTSIASSPAPSQTSPLIHNSTSSSWLVYASRSPDQTLPSIQKSTTIASLAIFSQTSSLTQNSTTNTSPQVSTFTGSTQNSILPQNSITSALPLVSTSSSFKNTQSSLALQSNMSNPSPLLPTSTSIASIQVSSSILSGTSNNLLSISMPASSIDARTILPIQSVTNSAYFPPSTGNSVWGSTSNAPPSPPSNQPLASSPNIADHTILTNAPSPSPNSLLYSGTTGAPLLASKESGGSQRASSTLLAVPGSESNSAVPLGSLTNSQEYQDNQTAFASSYYGYTSSLAISTYTTQQTLAISSNTLIESRGSGYSSEVQVESYSSVVTGTAKDFQTTSSKTQVQYTAPAINDTTQTVQSTSIEGHVESTSFTTTAIVEELQASSSEALVDSPSFTITSASRGIQASYSEVLLNFTSLATTGTAQETQTTSAEILPEAGSSISTSTAEEFLNRSSDVIVNFNTLLTTSTIPEGQIPSSGTQVERTSTGNANRTQEMQTISSGSRIVISPPTVISIASQIQVTSSLSLPIEVTATASSGALLIDTTAALSSRVRIETTIVAASSSTQLIQTTSNEDQVAKVSTITVAAPEETYLCPTIPSTYLFSSPSGVPCVPLTVTPSSSVQFSGQILSSTINYDLPTTAVIPSPSAQSGQIVSSSIASSSSRTAAAPSSSFQGSSQIDSSNFGSIVPSFTQVSLVQVTSSSNAAKTSAIQASSSHFLSSTVENSPLLSSQVPSTHINSSGNVVGASSSTIQTSSILGSSSGALNAGTLSTSILSAKITSSSNVVAMPNSSNQLFSSQATSSGAERAASLWTTLSSPEIASSSAQSYSSPKPSSSAVGAAPSSTEIPSTEVGSVSVQSYFGQIGSSSTVGAASSSSIISSTELAGFSNGGAASSSLLKPYPSQRTSSSVAGVAPSSTAASLVQVISSSTDLQSLAIASSTIISSSGQGESVSNTYTASSDQQSSSNPETTATTSEQTGPASAFPSNSNTPSAIELVFQVNPASGPVKKRQGSILYLGSSSPYSGPSCSQAIPFMLSNGTLSSNGQFVSANAETSWEPFQTNPTTGSITSTFSVQNGTLYWSNPSFVGGNALFCQMPSGEINVLFAGASDTSDSTYPHYPTVCVPVTLQAISASTCPSSASTVTITTTQTHRSIIHSRKHHVCPTVPPGFLFFTSATGALCVATTISWYHDCTPVPSILSFM